MRFAISIAVVLAVAYFTPQPTCAAPLYRLTDLGDLAGAEDDSIAYGLNAQGVVVGESAASPGGHRAFIKLPGQAMAIIDAPFGGRTSNAISINNSNHLIGDSKLQTPYYFNGTLPLTDIGDFPGGATSSRAFAINNSDVVVGYGTTATNTRAFKWSPGGTLQDLGALPNSNGNSSASDINDNGWIVGGSNVPSYSTPGYAGRAVVWKPDGTKINLGLLPGEVDPASQNSPASSGANAINGLNQVVGASFSNHGTFPFRWDEATGLHPLPFFPDSFGLAYSVPSDINDSGEIVGIAFDNNFHLEKAVYWGTDGQIRDLASLLDPSGAGWYLSFAYGINNSGQIVGYGNAANSPNAHAFLLTPVPEPSGIILAGLAFAGLLCAARRNVVMAC